MVHIHILGGMDMKILSANDTSVGLTDQIAPGGKQGPQDCLGVSVVLAFCEHSCLARSPIWSVGSPLSSHQCPLAPVCVWTFVPG